MATVNQFIDSARYDLRDYQTGLEFDDEELLEYVNRMAKVLDSTLTAMNSNFVRNTGSIVLSAPVIQYDIKTNLNSGKWSSVRSLWIDQNRLEKVSVDLMDYKRKFNTSVIGNGTALVVGGVYEILARTTLDFTACGASANTVGTLFTCTVAGTLGTGDAANSWNTGEPQFWTQKGGYILFEIATDATYIFDFFYNATTGTLAVTDNMPYNDVFDEVFRELLVMHAKAKKEGQIAPSEQMYTAMFRRVAAEDVIRTDFKPKYYNLGF